MLGTVLQTFEEAVKTAPAEGIHGCCIHRFAAPATSRISAFPGPDHSMIKQAGSDVLEGNKKSSKVVTANPRSHAGDSRVTRPHGGTKRLHATRHDADIRTDRRVHQSGQTPRRSALS